MYQKILKQNDMNIENTKKISSEKMPVLFVGHGNPMYAIYENKYSLAWKELSNLLSVPKAVLCISAHCLSHGTFVTMAENPETIHDFYGFPEKLFQVKYPVKGAKEFAEETIENVKQVEIQADYDRGLDHGAWSVLMNIYPNADVPVYELSIDMSKPPEYHFNLAKELAFLRKRGVIIIGSGNIVHNLRMVNWDKNARPYDWALEFDEFVKKNIEDNNPQKLFDYEKFGESAKLSVPTNDHYLPLIYTLALRDSSDELIFFNDTIDMSSIGMRSLIFL